MEHTSRRRVQRVYLAQPLLARLSMAQVVIVDLSVVGARIEHHMPLATGAGARLSFVWNGEEVVTECRVIRSRLERFSSGNDRLPVYHSGLLFEGVSPEMGAKLKAMIGHFISRALEEQKLNARGVMPEHDVDHMPIFRFDGQLTANDADRAATVGDSPLPAFRIAKSSGFISYRLERNSWRKKMTTDPEQPKDGFTISATEDRAQVELLCDAYVKADDRGRSMIRQLAALSLADQQGTDPRRFEP